MSQMGQEIVRAPCTSVEWPGPLDLAAPEWTVTDSIRRIEMMMVEDEKARARALTQLFTRLS